MISTEEKRLANAIGSKTARACDGCIKKRATWYCAADDAFLCQSCDTSIHSANQLARRHERVRLKTATLKSIKKSNGSATPRLPTWHQGVKRKARTPRMKPHKHGDDSLSKALFKSMLRVPEVEENEEETEQLLYRVPVFDPFVPTLTEASNSETNNSEDNNSICTALPCDNNEEALKEFLATELDLTEFDAEVEGLLNGSLDKESSLLEDLEMEEKEVDFFTSSLVKIKVESDQEMIGMREEEFPDGKAKAAKFSLRLDYDSIVTSWEANGSSPWTTGIRPDFEIDDCWPDYSVRDSVLPDHHYICMMGHEQGAYGIPEVPRAASVFMGAFTAAADEGGREARVLRYREKRRTRLFSKKIRYEVRKLNAEKRPRMKGRFVKRASPPSLLLH